MSEYRQDGARELYGRIAGAANREGIPMRSIEYMAGGDSQMVMQNLNDALENYQRNPDQESYRAFREEVMTFCRRVANYPTLMFDRDADGEKMAIRRNHEQAERLFRIARDEGARYTDYVYSSVTNGRGGFESRGDRGEYRGRYGGAGPDSGVRYRGRIRGGDNDNQPPYDPDVRSGFGPEREGGGFSASAIRVGMVLNAFQVLEGARDLRDAIESTLSRDDVIRKHAQEMLRNGIAHEDIHFDHPYQSLSLDIVTTRDGQRGVRVGQGPA